MKTYRAAVVGLGRMAGTIDEEVMANQPMRLPYSIAASCQASERLELVAGADIRPEKRAAFRQKWGVEALYEDYLEMVEQERPDLVAVCTTASGLPRFKSKSAPSADFRVDLHAEMATRLADAGVVMLYVEKAMACSMRAADALLETCEKNGTVLNIGTLRRYSNRWQVAREAIERGEIGKLKVALHYASTQLMHNHSHSIDTLSYMMGDPGIIAVRGELLPRELRVEHNWLAEDPTATYQIVFANGVEAWNVPAGHWEWELIGDMGSIRVTNNGVRATIRKAGPFSEKSPESALQDTPWAPEPEWNEIPMSLLEPESPTLTCLEDLVVAYESGRPSRGNVHVTHNVTEACLAVVESHRLGSAWIQLPMDNRDLYVFHA